MATAEVSVGLPYDLAIKKLKVLLLLRAKYRQRKSKRRWWVRPINKRRLTLGCYHSLISEMRLSDHESFFNFHCMSPSKFDDLLARVGPLLAKRNTNMRQSIAAGERLALTIRYLASGDSQISLAYAFRLGKSTVCGIIKECCLAISEILTEDYLKEPNTEKWTQCAYDFYHLWNFPNCVGAIDGKHVRIKAPSNSGTEYFNYKGYFSVALLAVCDAKYNFLSISVGDEGRFSDGNIFSKANFGINMSNERLGLPPPSLLPYYNESLPYVIVGDEAFPLKKNLMRPYPGRNLSEEKAVFNYRLSRARRVIENTFGIMCARWRIFHKPIEAHVDLVKSIIHTACCLHNFLKATDGKYCPPSFIDWEDQSGVHHDGDWRAMVPNNSGMTKVSRAGGNFYSNSAAEVRDTFCTYFNSPHGTVSWQKDHVRRGRLPSDIGT